MDREEQQQEDRDVKLATGQFALEESGYVRFIADLSLSDTPEFKDTERVPRFFELGPMSEPGPSKLTAKFMKMDEGGIMAAVTDHEGYGPINVSVPWHAVGVIGDGRGHGLLDPGRIASLYNDDEVSPWEWAQVNMLTGREFSFSILFSLDWGGVIAEPECKGFLFVGVKAAARSTIDADGILITGPLGRTAYEIPWCAVYGICVNDPGADDGVGPKGSWRRNRSLSSWLKEPATQAAETRAMMLGPTVWV